jgi:Mn-containing catalase
VILAKHLQELLGGAFGEMTGAMQYMLAHVEMIATMITRLLAGAPQPRISMPPRTRSPPPSSAAPTHSTRSSADCTNGLGRRGMER